MQDPSYLMRSTTNPAQPKITPRWRGLLKGVILTVTLAILGGQIARLPFFSIMGTMIISIMLGVLWKETMDVPTDASIGIVFSSKYLLRAGIMLMGLRLNIGQIVKAGFSVIWIDVIVIAFTITFMMVLGHLLSVDKPLSTLIAVGTAVCGAAAIVAVAPLIGAKKETTAISVACVAVMGTIGAIIYIFLYPYLGLDPYHYGVLAGSTLHELAHVIAAGVPGGDISSDAAVVVKLGRVALLIPVALMLGYYFRNKMAKEHEEAQPKQFWRNLPIPWFIFGFLAMSVVNTLDVLPKAFVQALVGLSVFLLSAAMAGLGLSIKLGDFKKVGKQTIFVAVTGFAALAALGVLLLGIFL